MTPRFKTRPLRLPPDKLVVIDRPLWECDLLVDGLWTYFRVWFLVVLFIFVIVKVIVIVIFILIVILSSFLG